MKCVNCGAENQDGFKFCMECGQPLPEQVICPDCGAANQPGFKFCMECGAALTPGAKADRKPAAKALRSRPEEPPEPPARSRPGPREKKRRSSDDEARQQAPAGPAAPAPAPAQTIIIRESDKRRAPVVVWVLLGSILTIMLCCGLLWFDVVDVPAGAIARLPPPLDDIAGQVAEAIEDRQVPVIGGPAAAPPPAAPMPPGGQPDGGAPAAGAEAGNACLPIKVDKIWGVGWLDLTVDFKFQTPDGNNDPDLYGDFDPDQWRVEVYPCPGCAPVEARDCSPLNFPWFECNFAPFFDEDCDDQALVQFTPIGGNDCPMQQVALISSKLRTKLETDLIDVDLSYSADGNALDLVLTNQHSFDLQQYWVTLESSDGWWSTYCTKVPGSDDLQCTGQFADYVYSDAPHVLVIHQVSEDLQSACILGALDAYIPDPPPQPPVPPSGPCGSGESYHDGWPYNGGCCTNGCWCEQQGQWGCWQTCNSWCGG